MSTKKRPVCVLCNNLWNSYELVSRLGEDTGKDLTRMYIQAQIDESAGLHAARLREFQQAEATYATYKDREAAYRKLREEKQHTARVLNHQVKEAKEALYPEVLIPIQKKRKHTDAHRVKDAFQHAFKYVPYADFEAVTFQMYTHAIISSKEYGDTMALYNLEQEAVQMVTDEDDRTLWTLQKTGILHKITRPVYKYPWRQLWAYMKWVDVARPLKATTAACPECGEERLRGDWIANHTSHCQCGFIPGLVFYSMKLGCSATESMKYASAAWSLYACGDDIYGKDADYKNVADLKNQVIISDYRFDEKLSNIMVELSSLKATIQNTREACFASSEYINYVGRPFFDIIRCTKTNCNGMVDLNNVVYATPSTAVCAGLNNTPGYVQRLRYSLLRQ